MLVSEIFHSIQGESTYVGLPCVFIRLAGCNLSCSWCDTEYARTEEGATDMSIDQIMSKLSTYDVSLVEITGGEPLLQDEAKQLINKVKAQGYTTLVESNGTVSFEGIDSDVVKVIDIKCPSSGQQNSFLMENIEFITQNDEVKFVISNIDDYGFAKSFVEDHLKVKTDKILFAPVKQELQPSVLADWILKDSLKVRLQLQIHKYIWT